MGTLTLIQKPLWVIERELITLIVNNNRNIYNQFNRLLKEIKLNTTITGFKPIWFFNFFKDNNIELTKVRRIKIYRLIRNAVYSGALKENREIINKQKAYYNTPFKSDYKNHSWVKRWTIKSKVYTIV